MIQNQIIPIHFGKGVDTKTDSKMVVAGKLLRLQDGVSTSPDQVDKRNGYSLITNAILGGGNITSPKLLKTYQNELVCADSVLGQLYTYSPTQAAWVPKGNYVPVQVTSNVVSRYFAGAGQNHFASNAATLGNISIFCRALILASGIAWVSVVDLTTNTALISDLQISPSHGAYCRAVVIGGTMLGIIYGNFNSNPTLITLNISGGNVVFNAPVTINADVFTGKFLSVAPTAAGAVMTYSCAAGATLRTVTINAAGTVLNTASQTVVSTATLCPTFTSVEPVSGNIWVYWYDNLTLKYTVYSSTLTTVLAATNIMTTADTAVLPMVSAQGATGTQTVIYSTSTQPGSNDPEYFVTTYRASVQSNGTVGTPVIFIQNAQVYSQVFTINGAQYVACLYASTTQGTYFVLSVATGGIVAKAMSGAAFNNPNSVYVSSPIQLSSSKVMIACEQSYALASGGAPVFGSSSFTIDGGSTELYQSINANKSLILNGGQVYSYDGKSVTELGFHVSPSVVSETGTGGGSMAAGNYLYYYTYGYTDEQGNIYESAPSTAHTWTSGASGRSLIYISTLGLTAKLGNVRNVSIRAYRTNVGGTLARLIGTFVNDTSGRSVLVDDTYSDAQIAANTPLYTAGGVVSNSAPPPAVAMCLHNNRVWLVPSDNPNQIWYSQTMIPTTGVNFSPLLLQQVDAAGGDIIAIAGMDDKLAILEQSAVLVVSGDGAGATGLGSNLTNPQQVPSDVGCNQSKGVITCPLGVIFKSSKGLYLLDRALNVKYLGMDVEAFNSQSVTACTMIANKSQIRFLTSSGLTLVYDYIFGQWSTFTNHTGYSADIWQGQYVYARTDGIIFKEAPGYYLDNTTPFPLLAQTAYLGLGGVQGFQRVRRLGMLGNYKNGASPTHGVQVSAAYDYSTNFSAPIPVAFGNASTSGAFQYRERLPIQKCESLSLLIQETVTGDAAESVSFSDLSLEAGVKSGLNRQSTSRTVG